MSETASEEPPHMEMTSRDPTHLNVYETNDSDTETVSIESETEPTAVAATDAVAFYSSHPDNASVSVVDSSEVQIGPRLIYNGPVVINQYVTSLGESGTSSELSQRALSAPNQGLEDVDVVTPTPPQVISVNNDTGSPSSPLECLRVRSRPALTLILLVVAGLTVGIVLAVTLGSSTGTPEPSYNPIHFTEPPLEPASADEDGLTNILSSGRRIISKIQWGGRPTRLSGAGRPPFALKHPTPYVIVSHTGEFTCFNVTDCSKRCRIMQEYNMDSRELNMADIAYNFMVGGDGNVYEGRGWDITNTRGKKGDPFHWKNVDVGFMGNFTINEPTKAQLEAAMQLLDLGVKLEKLAPDYKLFAHSDTNAKFPFSPGKNTVVHIKNWPHFTYPYVTNFTIS